MLLSMAGVAPYLGQQHDGLLRLLAAVGLLASDDILLHNGEGAVSRLVAAA